jgi:hypothetical protein
MKIVFKKYICTMIAVPVTLQLAGCISSEKYYEDVGLSRQAAYSQWKSRKERQEQSQPLVSGKLNVADCTKLALVNNKVLQRIIQERQIARGDFTISESFRRVHTA